jgi:Ca-activated chloride channel family protein
MVQPTGSSRREWVEGVVAEHEGPLLRYAARLNRILRREDFNDDRTDAGEIGAGHTVTALYELVPAGKPVHVPGVDSLKYQQPAQPAASADAVARDAASRELLTVKLRYKAPDGEQSKLLEHPVTDTGGRFGDASGDFKFAAAVAAFGMILRDSEHKGSATLDAVLELAADGLGTDREGYRAEFIRLVRQAK